MNGELPKGWVWTNLESITYIVLGQSPPSSTYNEEEIGLPFYQGKSEFGLIYPTPTKWCSPPKKIAEKDDILISVRAPVGPTNICPEKSCIGRGLAAIRGLGNINNKFILYLLRNFEEQLRNKATGTTFEAITGNVLRNFEVPVPPLAEQQRIVNKIEELFTNLDKGIESLEEVKSKLKVYRQAILKYAMEGKLTEKWREENKDNIEPEIFQLINYLGEKQTILTDQDSNDLDSTCSPTSWPILRLVELTKNINPGFPCGRHNNEGRGLLHMRPMNIDKEGRICLNSTKYVEINNYDSLVKGDILFNNTNSSELVGKTAYIDSDTNWAYSNHMTRIRIHNPLINNKWISTYLHYLFLSGYFGRICIHHVNQSSVGSKFLSEKIPIPMPSLSEQNLIIQNIDQYFSIVDKEFETINYLLAQSKTLRQSILKKAFEGKLVPQDPNDEPAEILLEKIKKQKLNKEKIVQEKLV